MKLSQIRAYETKLSARLYMSPYFNLLVGMGLWASFIMGPPAWSAWAQGLYTYCFGLMAIWSISRSAWLACAAEWVELNKRANDDGKCACSEQVDS